jgi:hypothetical protein
MLFDPFVLQNILAFSRKKETVMIYGKAFVIPDNFITPIDFNFEKLMRYNICHQTIFYPRHVFEQFEYATKFGALGDWDLNLKIFATYPSERIMAVDLMICKFFNAGISADWKSGQEYLKYFKNPFKLFFRYCNFQKAIRLSFRHLLKFRNFNKNRFLPFLSF